jgi:hypothetical protein
MSTPVTLNPMSNSPAPVKGSSTSPVEYVRALPAEDKQAVFLALLREALQLNGDRGLMPIDDEEGKPFGYYVPPKAAEELFKLNGPQLPAEQEAEIDRRIHHREAAIPMADAIAEFKREADARTPQPQ